MSDVAIRVEDLSKKYIIRHLNGARSGDGLRHALQDTAAASWRGLRGRFKRGARPAAPASSFEEFYALQDVTFEVKKGEVLGVVGRNGAGKSTLLKILSRITEPTSGRVGIKGRVASLLEVGTGFHPELTGRENIYLNGAILGMSRVEVRRKFDEIVAFSEIEKFLDTPVKRYSSGMYVRLAFAVAAHLEPDILIIDEVLAVGDAAFQKKCLGKMEDVAASRGRTVLFVSHSIPTVRSTCSRALLLKGGRLAAAGGVEEVLGQYLADGMEFGYSRLNRTRRIGGSAECSISEAWLTVEGSKSSEIEWDTQFEIVMEIEVERRVNLAPEYLIRDSNQHPILFSPSGLQQGFKATLDPGRYTVAATCPPMRLASGTYYIDLMLAESGVRFYDRYECGLRFTVPEIGRPPHGWVYTQGHAQGFIPFPVDVAVQEIGKEQVAETEPS